MKTDTLALLSLIQSHEAQAGIDPNPRAKVGHSQAAGWLRELRNLRQADEDSRPLLAERAAAWEIAKQAGFPDGVELKDVFVALTRCIGELRVQSETLALTADRAGLAAVKVYVAGLEQLAGSERAAAVRADITPNPRQVLDHPEAQ